MIQILFQVVATLLDKYKIESSPGDYSLYLVRETGERRLVGEQECPLTLRVTQGPHEVTSDPYHHHQQLSEHSKHYRRSLSSI